MEYALERDRSVIFHAGAESFPIIHDSDKITYAKFPDINQVFNDTSTQKGIIRLRIIYLQLFKYAWSLSKQWWPDHCNSCNYRAAMMFN